MTKAVIFYQYTMQTIKNKKNAHIIVNNSYSLIPKVEENKKHYNTCNKKRDDRARPFHHITGQPVKQILNVVDNNMLQNLPIFLEDVGMDEDIYGPNVSHLQGKKIHHNIYHREPIIIPNVPN